jgi:uncharacterized protein (TIGR00255 family)
VSETGTVSAMIRSMTGIGFGAWEGEDLKVDVEIRSVNHRSLKINSKLPECLFGTAPDLENLLKKELLRGTVYMTVKLTRSLAESAYTIHRKTLERYREELLVLKRDLGLSGEPTLEFLAGLPGVWVPVEETESSTALRQKITVVAEDALKKLVAMRCAEGERLGREIRERAKEIGNLLAMIDEKSPESVKAYRQRILERLRGVLRDSGVAVGEADIAREVALYAEKSDITEEIDRMRSHLAQIDSTLSEGRGVGRKLEFIAQEMLREANTMASKNPSGGLIESILQLKLEVDKIKEQVQNIE